MSRQYRELAAPHRPQWVWVDPHVSNRTVVRNGYCPGCKNELEHCACTDDELEELNFDDEADR